MNRTGNVVKNWTLALIAADGLTSTDKLVGVAIGQHAHYSAGTVYVGSKTLATVLETNERRLKERRSKLVDAGWLTDTGERAGRTKQAIVYRLTVPHRRHPSNSVPFTSETVPPLGSKGVPRVLHEGTKEPTKVPTNYRMADEMTAAEKAAIVEQYYGDLPEPEPETPARKCEGCGEALRGRATCLACPPF